MREFIDKEKQIDTHIQTNKAAERLTDKKLWEILQYNTPTIC